MRRLVIAILVLGGCASAPIDPDRVTGDALAVTTGDVTLAQLRNHPVTVVVDDHREQPDDSGLLLAKIADAMSDVLGRHGVIIADEGGTPVHVRVDRYNARLRANGKYRACSTLVLIDGSTETPIERCVEKDDLKCDDPRYSCPWWGQALIDRLLAESLQRSITGVIEALDRAQNVPLLTPALR